MSQTTPSQIRTSARGRVPKVRKSPNETILQKRALKLFNKQNAVTQNKKLNAKKQNALVRAAAAGQMKQNDKPEQDLDSTVIDDIDDFAIPTIPTGNVACNAYVTGLGDAELNGILQNQFPDKNENNTRKTKNNKNKEKQNTGTAQLKNNPDLTMIKLMPKPAEPPVGATRSVESANAANQQLQNGQAGEPENGLEDVEHATPKRPEKYFNFYKSLPTNSTPNQEAVIVEFEDGDISALPKASICEYQVVEIDPNCQVLMENRIPTEDEEKQLMKANLPVDLVPIKSAEFYTSQNQYNKDLMKYLGLYPKTIFMYKKEKIRDDSDDDYAATDVIDWEFGIFEEHVGRVIENILTFTLDLGFNPKTKSRTRKMGLTGITKEDLKSNMYFDWPKWASGKYAWKNGNREELLTIEQAAGVSSRIIEKIDLKNYSLDSIDSGLYLAAVRLAWFVTDGMNCGFTNNGKVAKSLAGAVTRRYTWLAAQYQHLCDAVENTIKGKPVLPEDTRRIQNVELRTFRSSTMTDRLQLKIENRCNQIRFDKTGTRKERNPVPKLPEEHEKTENACNKSGEFEKKRTRDNTSKSVKYGSIIKIEPDTSTFEAISENFQHLKIQQTKQKKNSKSLGLQIEGSEAEKKSSESPVLQIEESEAEKTNSESPVLQIEESEAEKTNSESPVLQIEESEAEKTNSESPVLQIEESESDMQNVQSDDFQKEETQIESNSSKRSFGELQNSQEQPRKRRKKRMANSFSITVVKTPQTL